MNINKPREITRNKPVEVKKEKKTIRKRKK